jgi:hypothetical protein
MRMNTHQRDGGPTTLQIRSTPRELRARLRAAAALREQTLRQYVLDALVARL